MDNKIKIVIVILIVLSLACTTAYTYPRIKNTASDNITPNNSLDNLTQNNTSSDLNNATVERTKGPIKDIDVQIIQKGPNKPVKKGTYATVTYTITNKGKQTIYNAEIQSQQVNKYIGTLKPGQTKKHVHKQYMALDPEVEEDMPGAGPIPPKLYWGGVSLRFEDDNGKLQHISSNVISLRVID